MNDTEAFKLTTNQSLQFVRGNQLRVSAKVLKPGKDKVEVDLEIVNLKVLAENTNDPNDIDIIRNCFKQNTFLCNIDKEHDLEVINSMTLCSVAENDYIFKEGNTGFYFYILKEGKLELSQNRKILKVLEGNVGFGELALLNSSPRSLSIKALVDCKLWILNRDKFRKIVNNISRINFDENMNFINKISVLSVLLSRSAG